MEVKIFCVINIGKFNIFNDKYGHYAGDDLISHIEKTLNLQKINFRRVSGNEWIFVLTDVITVNDYLRKLLRILNSCVDAAINIAYSLYPNIESIHSTIYLNSISSMNFKEGTLLQLPNKSFSHIREFKGTDFYEKSYLELVNEF